MKKLNKKSDTYFINKMVSFKPLNISKVHLVDDDCNEFIATVVGVWNMKGYNSPKDINVIDYEEYTSEKWNEMIQYIEYERAEIVA